MINICIDGNYCFHKTFGVFAGYGDVDPGKVLKDKKEQGAFIRKVATDLCASLKMLPLGGRLVFVTDSRSWRKDVEIEDGGYKSGRVKDESTDWTVFFQLLQSFGEQLEKIGFVFSKVEGAEGDDLLLYWSKKFNDNGESCIIISGDHDLHQLARMKGPDIWTGVWNSNAKKNVLAVPSGWKENWLNDVKSEVSIFNMASTISPEKDRFKEFIKKVSIEEIDSLPFIFNKALIGDTGDSVPSVWEYTSGEKLIRFTQSKADKIYLLLQESIWKNVGMKGLISDNEFLDWLAPLILKITKDVDSTDNRKKVKFNFLRNVKLVWLDNEVIPENIGMTCDLEVLRGTNLEKKNISLDRIKIIEGTEWVNSGVYTPKGFDPFENFLK